MVLFTLAFVVCACGVGDGMGDRVIEESVDLIELNHFYDPCGRHVYDQVIFYHLAPETGHYRVRAWCLVEDRETLSRRPTRDAHTGLVRVEWFESDQKLLRRLHSPMYRESWTQVDPERLDKRKLDERLRLSLVQSPQRARAERQLAAEALRTDETPEPASNAIALDAQATPIYVAVGGRH